MNNQTSFPTITAPAYGFRLEHGTDFSEIFVDEQAPIAPTELVVPKIFRTIIVDDQVYNGSLLLQTPSNLTMFVWNAQYSTYTNNQKLELVISSLRDWARDGNAFSSDAISFAYTGRLSVHNQTIDDLLPKMDAAIRHGMTRLLALYLQHLTCMYMTPLATMPIPWFDCDLPLPTRPCTPMSEASTNVQDDDTDNKDNDPLALFAPNPTQEETAAAAADLLTPIYPSPTSTLFDPPFPPVPPLPLTATQTTSLFTLHSTPTLCWLRDYFLHVYAALPSAETPADDNDDAFAAFNPSIRVLRQQVEGRAEVREVVREWFLGCGEIGDDEKEGVDVDLQKGGAATAITGRLRELRAMVA